MQDVIRDAVYHQLKKHVKSVMQVNHTNFGIDSGANNNMRDFPEESDKFREDSTLGEIDLEPMELANT